MPELTLRQALKDNFRSEVTSDSGVRFKLVAHRKGYPVSDPYVRVVLPVVVNLTWEVLRTLRFFVVHRGHWVIEVTQVTAGATTNELIRRIEVPSRRKAIQRIEGEAAALRSAHGS